MNNLKKLQIHILIHNQKMIVVYINIITNLIKKVDKQIYKNKKYEKIDKYTKKIDKLK